MQYDIPGGHELRGAADLADGHARFCLIFVNVLDDGEIVGSHLTQMHVYLNNCIVRDPDLARRLFAEATGGGRRPTS